MASVRKAYIRHLRDVALNHNSTEGHDLIRERILTERVDRDLKELQVFEKRNQLIDVDQLYSEMAAMVSMFRSELLAMDEKMVKEIKAIYGIELDSALVNQYTFAALEQFGRFAINDRNDH